MANSTYMKFNKEWHATHVMPKSPTLTEKMQWHIEHSKHCGCRPMPESIKLMLQKQEQKI